MTRFDPYIGPISSAIWFFPFVALLFTIPYIISRYNKYGAVLFFRTLVVYSFIFYLICVYFLGILPLPSIASVARLRTQRMQLVPFSQLKSAMHDGAFSISEPASWLRVMSTGEFFQIVANILMFFPFGIYMRYCFRRNFWQTLLMGFLLSLSIELLQLSGLMFIYPRPYRLFDVNDLINNTLGAMLGYWFAKVCMRFLPSQERLDRRAYKKGERVSITRSAVAAGIDWLVCILIAALVLRLLNLPRSVWPACMYVAPVLIYFVLIQYLMRGKTLGKNICQVRLISQDGSVPKFWQVAVRYISLYFGFLATPVFGLKLFSAAADVQGWRFWGLTGLVALCLALFAMFVFSTFVHAITHASKLLQDKISRTQNISTIRPRQ